ncbi:imidazolonepropionase [Guggenheimella bovis]
MKLLLKHANLTTFLGNKPHKGQEMRELHTFTDTDILLSDGVIEHIGSIDEDCETIDCEGRLVTPGYVDSHTHFIFGGDRSNEYRMRLEGASYLEIKEQGGGIQATVKATREATLEDLVSSGKERLKGFIAHGVTTAESKSGYGLDWETEKKMLEAMDVLQKEVPVRLVKTFMGAHEIAPEFKGDAKGYLDYILREVEPKVEDVSFFDIFTERGVFEIEESREFLEELKRRGRKLKLHADELAPIDGAVLAAEVGAISADHLLQISDRGIDAMKASGTIATLLPMTAFSIKSAYAPARKMIDKGLAVALATDYNPGSCHSYSIPLLIALATNYMGMTTPEVLAALTINGACAVGLEEKVGTAEVGKRADLVIHDVKSLDALSYLFGVNTVQTVIQSGRVVYDKRRSYV